MENIDIVFNNLKKNKEMVIQLLEDILKVSISDLDFKGREYFNSITDYDFSLIKLRIKYTNQKEDEIYLFLSLLCTTFARPILMRVLAISKNYYKRKFNISTLIHRDEILIHYSSLTNN